MAPRRTTPLLKLTASRRRTPACAKSFLLILLCCAAVSPFLVRPVRAAIPGPLTCPHPVILPGQDRALEQMVTPSSLPQGLTQTDGDVLRDRIRVHFVGTNHQRYDYELLPIALDTEGGLLRSARWSMHRLQPCAVAGVACPVSAELLKQLDNLLVQAVIIGEDAVSLGCQDPANSRDAIGLKLQQIDIELRQSGLQVARSQLDLLTSNAETSQWPVENRVDVALLWLRLGVPERAVVWAQRAVQHFEPTRDLRAPLSPNQRLLGARMAAAQAILHQPALALTWLDLCGQRAQPDRCSVIPVAQALALSGEITAATLALQAEIKRSPTDPELHHTYIDVLARSDNHAQSLVAAQAAVAAVPGDHALEQALGDALARVGRPSEALHVFEAELAKDPTDVHARLQAEALRQTVARSQPKVSKGTLPPWLGPVATLIVVLIGMVWAWRRHAKSAK